MRNSRMLLSIAAIALIFARDIQDVHIAQTVELLKHKNPYTGTTYAEDPALAFVEMHNEDNLYWPIVRSRVEQAPTYKKIFCRMFSEWLQKRYGSHDGLIKAWGADAVDAFPKFLQDEQLEKDNIYPLANCFSILWELEHRAALKRRMLDTAQFLYEADGRQELGMGDCQLRKGQGQTRHMYLVMLAYSLLMSQLKQGHAKDWALCRPTTIGDACRAMLSETLQTTLAWVVKQVTETSRSYDHVAAKLGLA